MKQILTNSRMSSFKQCRRLHWYSFEAGLRRIEDARALRMGGAFHDGVEALGRGHGVADACLAVRSRYRDLPDGFDAYEWAIECETILRLVCAYEWRWRDSKIEDVQTEFAFQIPLVNPDTGSPTPIFDLAGKNSISAQATSNLIEIGHPLDSSSSPIYTPS